MNERNRKWIFLATAVVLLVLLTIGARHLSTEWDLPKEYSPVQRLPRILPDYSETVIPPNIAPLNFLVEEPGVEYRVRIHGAVGEDIHLGSHSSSVVIPQRPWRELLIQNRGGRIELDIYVKGEDGRWSRFDSIKNDVAQEEIDSHLVYRLLGPVCSLYRNMGIYQRNLENYDESPIVTNDKVEVCLNCHNFSNNHPDTFSFEVRPGKEKGETESGMIVVRDGHAARLKTKTKATPRPPSYASWHPGGSFAAFSMNKTRQLFRGVGAEIRDVFDIDSDLAAVNVLSGAVSTSPGIANPDRQETFPNWSADGKILYFSSYQRSGDPTELLASEAIHRVKYDLMRISYDIEKDAWGQPEMVLSSAATGMSITEPRASPDGRYLLFCMADYGTFPVFRSSSDLYIMDVKSDKYRRLECNSEQSDSWHCWSSNSRWIVFSSKRDNGLLARPYFSYLDAEGREHKPFILPQKDPTFYDTWPRTYNVPELVSGPINIPQEELEQVIRSKTTEPQKPSSVKDDESYQHNESR